MVAKPIGHAQSKVYAGQIRQLPQTNHFSRFGSGLVMSASTQSESVATKTTAPSIDSGAVKAAFGTKVHAALAQTKVSAPAKVPFHIENSSLAKGMWCIEDDEGVVFCNFEECQVEPDDAADKCQSEFEV